LRLRAQPEVGDGNLHRLGAQLAREILARGRIAPMFSGGGDQEWT